MSSLLSPQAYVHYFLHLVAPFLLAAALFRRRLFQAYALLLLTMLIDLDHLPAQPVFAPGRCSIGFHPLHTWPALLVYAGMLFRKGTLRILGTGLLFHLLTDFIDCLFMYAACPACLKGQWLHPFLQAGSRFLLPA